MRDVNILENIKEQRRISMIIIFVVSVIIFGAYLVRLNSLVSGDTTFNLTKEGFIRIFNALLAMLGVLSCFLSYTSNKKDELFIMVLMYTMFFLDICISNWVYYKYPELLGYNAIGTSFCRVIIAIIAVSNMKRLKKFIVNNKMNCFILVVAITFLCANIEYRYMMPYSKLVIRLYQIYNVLLFIVYIAISIGFFVKSVTKKEYIYGVIGSSALVFSIKSIYDFAYTQNHLQEINSTSTSLINIGFITFILGLFLELSQSIKINRVLDEQRSLFFKIVEENKHSNIIVCDEKYCIKYMNIKTIQNSSINKCLSEIEIGEGKRFDIGKLCENNIDLNEVEKRILEFGYYNRDIHIKNIDKILDISIQTFKRNNKRYKVVTITDVSEKYELEKALLEYQRIKQEEVVKNEFFSNISHELKTPLNIIYSANQLLGISAEKDDFKEIYLKYKNCLDINCKRMLRLIDNIVDITKLDVGFKSPKFGQYDIVKIVEDITLSVVSYAKVKGIEVLFDTDIEELEIKCDPDMMERVLLNLLSNAIKFSNKGGSILVEIFNNEKWVGIKVKDDGIGIPLNIQDKIFDRFVQGDKSIRRKKEGSGIGLSLVKSIVELMDGTVELISDGKKGTEFIVLLPNKTINNKENTNNNYHIDLQRIQLELSDIYELYNNKENNKKV